MSEETLQFAVFPFLADPKQLLVEHGCLIHEQDNEWTITFPEWTTHTVLSPPMVPTRARIVLPDGLELREVRDLSRGKSWLSFLPFSINRPLVQENKEGEC